MSFNLKIADQINYNVDGLVSAIDQQHDTGEVLMLAWMNKESLIKTLETNNIYYWSRSRNKLWRKGETSKNFQSLVEFRFDCDKDCILLLVNQIGPACHTGKQNCFYNAVNNNKLVIK